MAVGILRRPRRSRSAWRESSTGGALEYGVHERKVGEMAVGVLTAAPEFTKQIYEDVTEKMFGHASPMREDEAPEGLIVHSAGQGEQGYYVYDICEAREAVARLLEDKLGRARGEVRDGSKRAEVAESCKAYERRLAASMQAAGTAAHLG